MKILVLLLLFAFLAGCTQAATCPFSPSKEFSPADVVTGYYNSFEKKDYSAMYDLISDGFKKIEPTASSYRDFEAEMSRFYVTAESIRLVSVEKPSVTNDTASVGYKIEVKLREGSVKSFNSVFTVKKRCNGWKLVHPYGQNIDAS